MKRVFMPALIGIALLAAACDNGDQSPGGATGERPATKVVTTPLMRRSIVDEIAALGTAGANESVEIRPRVASIVTRIGFEEGEVVQRGDMLVELENSEIRAGLAVAEAALSESRSTYNRSLALASSQAISASNLEQLKAQMQVDEAQVKAAEARLANTVIRAPFSGRIGLRRVSPGSFVDPSTVITTLDDTGTIKLDFSVPEAFIAAVSEGMNITANSLVYPDRTFKGVVASVDTRLDPVARSVQVRAIIPNPDGLLKPGMFLSVDLKRERGAVLVAPEEAIVPDSGAQYVFRVEDGRALQREVTLGRRVPGLVEIVSGAEEGDIVITEGTHKVRDGSEVEVVERQAAGTSAQLARDAR